MTRHRVFMSKLIFVTILIALIPAAAGAQNDEVGISVGSTPEAVTIEDLDGNPVDLGQWMGKKPLLLEFWARWCEQCEALEPRMREAHERYSDRMEFRAVGVGVNQNPRSIRRHLARHPMPFPVLWDGEGKATRTYRAPTTAYVVILDAAGTVAYTGVGPDQDIAAAVQRVIGAAATDTP
jgi:thiol-disulfide isomerase/thioredoxin